MTLDEAIQHAREVANGDRCECAYTRCSDCWRRHEQLAEWLEELRDRRQASGHELISRAAAIEAVRYELDWLGSRDGPAAGTARQRSARSCACGSSTRSTS